MLTGFISSGSVYCVAHAGQKTAEMSQFWSDFHILGGALMPIHFYRSRPNLAGNSRHRVYAYVPNFVLIGSVSHHLVVKNPNFATFWTGICGVSSWWRSMKVEHGCTTTNLPYSAVSKSFLYSSAFMAKSCVQTLTFKSVTDKQINEKLNVLAAELAGKIQALPTMAWWQRTSSMFLHLWNFWGSKVQFWCKGVLKIWRKLIPST